MKDKVEVKALFDKRHYEVIAERIRTVESFHERKRLINLFGDMFAKDNDNFDMIKFVSLCYKWYFRHTPVKKRGEFRWAKKNSKITAPNS